LVTRICTVGGSHREGREKRVCPNWTESSEFSIAARKYLIIIA
jgi:hypothetical protein